jgi:hypothetical protein
MLLTCRKWTYNFVIPNHEKMNLNKDFFSMIDNFDRLSALISRNNENLDCNAKAKDCSINTSHAKMNNSQNEAGVMPSDGQYEGRLHPQLYAEHAV